MPRSSFSLNPLLKVSRPVSACSRCRAAKVKCDGKLPACTACEKAGRESECSAANDQFARGKERSYVAALELRIEKLERRLQYAKNRKASLGFQEPDLSSLAQDVDRRNSMAHIRAAIHRKAARTRENSDVNSLISDFGFLSVDANTRDFEPSSTNMTFARLVLTAVTNDELPGLSEVELPPRQTALSLVQFYITHIYSFYPFFQEAALFNIMNDLYHDDERVIKDSDLWLFHMVLAIGSTAQSRRLGDEHYQNGLVYARKAMESADRALAPGYVTQIQSLLLLTQYSMLDPAHFDSWHLIGITTRAVVDLGLHQDPPVSSVADKSALDMRRRIFYCVYSLDRAISMVHARCFSFTDNAINVAFPSTPSKKAVHDAMPGPHSPDPALLMFQLRRAQSFWYQELYQSHASAPLPDPSAYIWQMCYEMQEWAASLPQKLPASVRQLFDQELRYSYVYCIAPSARAPEITDYNRTLIFEYALAYLDTMHDIAQDGLNSAFYTYHDALKVYFMASQLLAVLWDAEQMLLDGPPVPRPMVRPGTAPPPPNPRRHIQGVPLESNASRSLSCLERVDHTLGRFGERWNESAMLKVSFESMARETMQRLRSRKQMESASLDSQQQQYQGRAVQGIQAVPPPQQQQPREVRWIGVDPGQTMRGGGPAPQ